MKCLQCGKGMADGIALFRQNEKGQPGVWACREHNAQPIDREVSEIVEALAAAKPEGGE